MVWNNNASVRISDLPQNYVTAFLSIFCITYLQQSCYYFTP
jgi:hypothetical protein